VIRQSLRWFFRNRETGDITVAQAPNIILWVVIAAGVLLWVLPATGTPALTLEFVFKGGLLVWAVDEIFRGVNPWRRCLWWGPFWVTSLRLSYDRSRNTPKSLPRVRGLTDIRDQIGRVRGRSGAALWNREF
jgi:hypothetical protein